jgi:hypothetical protein
MLTLKPDIAKQVFLTWLKEDYSTSQLYCDIYNSLNVKVQFYTSLNHERMYTIVELKPWKLYLQSGTEHDVDNVIRYIKTEWWIITNTSYTLKG